MEIKRILKVKRITESAKLPEYAHNNDTCFDIYTDSKVTIPAHQKAMIKTGLKFDIPKGYMVKVYLRSSVSLKTPLVLANGVGIIDEGYKGEIGILVANISDSYYTIDKGIKLAQGELRKYEQAHIEETNEIGNSDRGEGGFGSTGE